MSIAVYVHAPRERNSNVLGNRTYRASLGESRLWHALRDRRAVESFREHPIFGESALASTAFFDSQKVVDVIAVRHRSDAYR